MHVVHMGKSVCERITSVCFFVNKRTNDKLRLPDEQTVNGLRKITWTSVFRINVYIYMYIYIYIFFTYVYSSISAYKYIQIYGQWNYIYVYINILSENGTNDGNLRLFAPSGKGKRQTSIYLLQTETENASLFSFVSKR
jgi:hypothetical protein